MEVEDLSVNDSMLFLREAIDRISQRALSVGCDDGRKDMSGLL